MPHTVRWAGAATNPTTKATNVTIVGVVKHGRNASDKGCNDFGTAGNTQTADHHRTHTVKIIRHADPATACRTHVSVPFRYRPTLNIVNYS
jgi:hypothetical protein